MTPSHPPTEERRAGLERADAAYAAVFAALAVWSWVGIGLAEAGRFRASWLLVLAAAGLVGGGRRRVALAERGCAQHHLVNRRRRPPRRGRPCRLARGATW